MRELSLEEWYFELFLWQYARSDSFTSMLFDLIGKADEHNRRRIWVAFPKAVFAWECWYFSGDPEKFFRDQGCFDKWRQGGIS
jgi:hypothetical protein